LGDPKLNLQIWKKEDVLEKIEFFQWLDKNHTV
jgi:hypothetical protein